MRILVIGGTRLTGPYIVRSLVAKGHQVTVFHRGQTQADLPPSVNHILGDKNNFADFGPEFKRLAPEVVLDMVAYTRQDAETLMYMFKGIARRVVVPSSSDVYRVYGRLHGTEPGPPDPIPLAEEAPLREKLSVHGEEYEKRWVEQAVMGDTQLPGTVLRYPMIYGPNDGGRTFPLIKPVEDKRSAILVDEVVARWRWSRGFAENVAWATVLAVLDERAAGRIYNVAEPEALSYLEWAQRVMRAAGWNGRIIVVPHSRLKVQGDYTHHWVVDTTRIRQELGYAEIVSQEEALRQTVAWQRVHPPNEFDTEDFDYAAEDAILAEMESQNT
jgi:nucleoside-diphosphate-sugar epimerase